MDERRGDAWFWTSARMLHMYWASQIMGAHMPISKTQQFNNNFKFLVYILLMYSRISTFIKSTTYQTNQPDIVQTEIKSTAEVQRLHFEYYN